MGTRSSPANGITASQKGLQAAATHGPRPPSTLSARCFLHATVTAARRGAGGTGGGWLRAHGRPGPERRRSVAAQQRGSSSAVCQGLRWPCWASPHVTAHGKRVAPSSLCAVRGRGLPGWKQRPPHSRSESPAPSCCGRPFPTRKPHCLPSRVLPSHRKAVESLSQAPSSTEATHTLTQSRGEAGFPRPRSTLSGSRPAAPSGHSGRAFCPSGRR